MYDLYMAANAILNKRGLAPKFRLEKHTPENVEYWASKRVFGFLVCDSEQDVIDTAVRLQVIEMVESLVGPFQ